MGLLGDRKACWWGKQEGRKVSSVTSSLSSAGGQEALCHSYLMGMVLVLSMVWIGLGRSVNGSDMKARLRSHPSIHTLLSPLLKQSCFIDYLHGLAPVYKIQKEAFGLINGICTA